MDVLERRRVSRLSAPLAAPGNQKDHFQPVSLREAHGPDGQRPRRGSQTRVSVTGAWKAHIWSPSGVCTAPSSGCPRGPCMPPTLPRPPRPGPPALRAPCSERHSALAPGHWTTPVPSRGWRSSSRNPGRPVPLTHGAFPFSRPTRPVRNVSSFYFG